MNDPDRIPEATPLGLVVMRWFPCIAGAIAAVVAGLVFLAGRSVLASTGAFVIFFRRARPLPPHEEMVIDDLSEEEGRRLPRCAGGVTAWPLRGPVVIDTDVYDADLVSSRLAAIYEPVIVGRRRVHLVPDSGRAPLRSAPAALGRSAHAEARSEDRRSGDGPLRAGLVLVYAQLRVDCERIGHALGQRDHDADRWIAATALRLGVPLVSNDQIFKDAPGLVLESATRT